MSSGTFLLLGSSSLAFALLLIHGPLIISGPTGEQYLAGIANPWQQCYWDLGRDASAGIAVLLGLLLFGFRSRPGGTFAAIAASMSAPAFSYWLASLFFFDQPAWAALCAGSMALVLAPCLRERGMGSLLLVSLLVASGLVLTRRDSLVIAREAQSIQVLRLAILDAGLRRHFISAGEEIPLRTRRVLALSLWPEDELERVDLLCLPAGSEIEDSLLDAGWRGMRITRGGFEVLEPRTPAAEPMIELSYAGLKEGVPELAYAQELSGRLAIQALTPCGTVQQIHVLPRERLRIEGERLQDYSRLVAGLPAEMPLLLRLKAVAGDMSSPWILVRLP
ncbi:MAG: hypothetical protein ACYTG5_13705 [Planctomycetota bacterium]|jgi:hypothetical protein